MGKGGAAGELAACMRGVCVVGGGRWEWRADWGVVWCAGMGVGAVSAGGGEGCVEGRGGASACLHTLSPNRPTRPPRPPTPLAPL